MNLYRIQYPILETGKKASNPPGWKERINSNKSDRKAIPFASISYGACHLSYYNEPPEYSIGPLTIVLATLFTVSVK